MTDLVGLIVAAREDAEERVRGLCSARMPGSDIVARSCFVECGEDRGAFVVYPTPSADNHLLKEFRKAIGRTRIDDPCDLRRTEWDCLFDPVFAVRDFSDVEGLVAVGPSLFEAAVAAYRREIVVELATALFHFRKNGEEYAFGTMRRLLGKLRSDGESSCERMARVVVGLGYLHDPNQQAFSGRDRLYVVSLMRACGVEIDDDVSWGGLERIVVDEAEKDARQHEHAQNRS